MSISFNDPPNPETLKKMRKLFGNPDEQSDREFLYKALPNPITSQHMGDICRKAGQPMTLTYYDVGDEIKLSDGRKFRCVEGGWQCVSPRV